MKSNSLKLSILLLLLLCETLCQKSQPKIISVKALNTYNQWRVSQKKVYSNEDEKQFRQLIFLDNYAKFEEHNSNPQNTYKMGINQFSDMTQEEIALRVLNPNIADDTKIQKAQSQNVFSPLTAGVTNSFVPHNPDAHYAQGGIPTAVDWRTVGYNTPVRDQGSCGSCWAHSAVYAMEGINYKWNKSNKSFSAQQLVDCAIRSKGYPNDGCQGGGTLQAAQYAIKYGMYQYHEYPYTGVQGTCTIDSPLSPSNQYFFPYAMWFVQYGAEYLKEAIAFAPTSVLVDATNWPYFESGVFNGCRSQGNTNHAVTAVGYDSDGNWIIKNSWGPNWGNQGYMKIAAGNSCGILSYPWVFVSIA